ncbi:hypothetical protein ACFWIO_10895 [Streptomyces diastatochromogenes]|uniref:hypothetical protein n=1 Tax=Streptomyces diastatochromogenes TaxID=42236 RepID=UPI00365C73D5
MADGRGRGRLRTALATVTALASFVAPVALATDAAAAARQTCTTPTVLSGSHFEIDTDANLIVNGGADCIDWLTGGAGTGLRSGVAKAFDRASGATDDSFTGGTSENDANPKIDFGSIPPNKSDLTTFGVFSETNTTPKFLELFWRRQNSPQGSVTMDFELNQKFCDPKATPTNCANNGSSETATPIRTAGDKLITYDLAQGGSTPTISIRSWTGSAWGPASVISGGRNPSAVGSINTSTIAANQADALGFPPPMNGSSVSLDPFTFGEAAISYDAIFPAGGPCTSFGSAYVKSRASTSFSSELKDFIAPERVQITNCSSLTTNATSTAEVRKPIHDSATLTGASTTAGGTITFRLFDQAGCPSGSQVFTSTVPVNGGSNNTYNSTNFTPTSVGTYYWTASYSGDANNSPATTACGASGESTVVTKARPSISTTLSDSTITVGDSVHDSATLTGETPDADGTVTYTVYSDNACTQDPRDAGTKTVTNGSVPDSDSLSFPTVGTFYWQATYSGDPNNGDAQSTCTSEALTVRKAGADVATAQHIFPQDSATVTATAGGQPTGTVTFKLYGPGDTMCQAMPVYNSGPVSLSGGQAGTSNDTFSVDAASSGDYRWEVTYSGDGSHNGATSTCGTERATITVTEP